MKYHKKILSGEKGQVAIIVALMLVCLLGIAALVVDLGSLYQKKASIQTVADAAALAGVQELPESRREAAAVAIDYAEKNGFKLYRRDIRFSSTLASFPDTITVRPSDPDVPTYFSGVFGMETVEVGSYASAMVGSPVEYYNVVPWLAVVPEGEDWQEYLDPGSEKIISSNPRQSDFLAWDYTESGGLFWLLRYYLYIIYGYPDPLESGDIIYAKMINHSLTIHGTQARVGTWDDFDDLVTESNGILKLAVNDDQFVIVPVAYEVEIPGHPGNWWTEKVEILGFAPFIITGIEGHGNRARVVGRFIHQAMVVTSGEITAVEKIGFRTVRLVR